MARIRLNSCLNLRSYLSRLLFDELRSAKRDVECLSYDVKRKLRAESFTQQSKEVLNSANDFVEQYLLQCIAPYNTKTHLTEYVRQ